MSTIANRIKQIIEAKGMTITAFANSIEVAQGTLSNVFKRGSIPRSDMLQAILLAYPEINAHWLLTGNGKMFLQGQVTTDVEKRLEEVESKLAMLYEMMGRALSRDLEDGKSRP